MKRAFDVAAALLGVLLLLPLWLAIALLVRATSPGPVFYRAQRVGRGGRPFRLLKFRTMRPGADREGAGITRAGDSRVTAAGRWLRRTKLDETPQLLNVLAGSMSLVGPRPEDPRYVARYAPEQRRVLRVRPGITSAASVRYRREEQLLRGDDWERLYLEVVMPDKLRLDLDYLDRRTFCSDLGVLWQTVWPWTRRAAPDTLPDAGRRDRT